MLTAKHWPSWSAVLSIALQCGMVSAMSAPLTCIFLLLGSEELSMQLLTALPWVFVVLALAGIVIGTSTGILIGIPLLMILGRLGWFKQQILVPLGAAVGLLVHRLDGKAVHLADHHGVGVRRRMRLDGVYTDDATSAAAQCCLCGRRLVALQIAI